jgi:hypothetical protein
MTPEDEEFNRIEREAKLRMEAVKAALDRKAENARELGLDYEPVPENFMDALKFDVAMREWRGLTDEERDAMIGATDLSGTYYYDDLYAVILLAEGKLKEKNT